MRDSHSHAPEQNTEHAMIQLLAAATKLVELRVAPPHHKHRSMRSLRLHKSVWCSLHIPFPSESENNDSTPPWSTINQVLARPAAVQRC